MKLKNHLFIFIPLLLFFTTCRKETALDKLPPATQEGKNTFGCLVNGKAWMPDNGCDLFCPSDLKFYYYSDADGQFAVTAELKKGSINQAITIGLDSCSKAGEFVYLKKSHHPIRLSFINLNQVGCELSTSQNDNVNCVGKVSITKFDLTNGVISGTFEFSLSAPGCETVNITNGRFDGKL